MNYLNTSILAKRKRLGQSTVVFGLCGWGVMEQDAAIHLVLPREEKEDLGRRPVSFFGLGMMTVH